MISIKSKNPGSGQILYDYSYGTRGNTGIPGDTRSVAHILLSLNDRKCDFLLFPKNYVRRKLWTKSNSILSSTELGKALRNNSGRTVLPSKLLLLLSTIQSLSLRRAVYLTKLSQQISKSALDYLQLSEAYANDSEIYIANLSNITRFIRPNSLRPFKLKTKRYRYFVQQQIDPITLSRKTKHIVRLHDILPITHPQYFDEISVSMFQKGLYTLLRNRDIVWVFDTVATSLEFKNLFGNDREVRHIPCEVGVRFNLTEPVKLKTKNLIVCLNTIEPRKNILRVIQAFKLAKKTQGLRSDYTLAILGSKGWQETNLFDQLSKNAFGDDVDFIDSPSDDVVAEYLAEAKILISAAAAEGFGLPPLEGMLFGCLPVVSDIPQHRENIGKYGIYFDSSTAAIATALNRAHLELQTIESNYLREMHNYVKANFGRSTISKMWEQLLN